MSLKRSPLFVLPLVAAASTANAADISPVVIPPMAPLVMTPDPQTLIQIEGGPIFSRSRVGSDPDGKFGEIPNDRGFYLGAALRRMLPSNIGMQAAITGTWLRENFIEGDGADLYTNLRFQTLDLDVALHPTGDIGTRFYVGVRALHSVDSLNLVPNVFGGTERTSTGTAWMFGPRVGFDADVPLGTSHFSLVANVSAAVLFGHANVLLNAPDINTDASGFRMAVNVEGQAGLAWHPSTSTSFTIGYRGQQWWGLLQATEVTAGGGVTVFTDPDKFLHGPFARFSLQF